MSTTTPQPLTPYPNHVAKANKPEGVIISPIQSEGKVNQQAGFAFMLTRSINANPNVPPSTVPGCSSQAADANRVQVQLNCDQQRKERVWEGKSRGILSCSQHASVRKPPTGTASAPSAFSSYRLHLHNATLCWERDVGNAADCDSIGCTHSQMPPPRPPEELLALLGEC